MKKYLIVFLAALCACQDKNNPAPAVDPFIGTWHYTDSYSNLDLEVNFLAYKTDGEYGFRNVSIEYSEIPSTENLTYKIELSDPFADNEGFGRIRIIGSWTTTCPNGLECDKWIFVDFNYAKIYQEGGNTSYTMSVQNVTVYMINKDDVILEDQEMKRTSL